MSKTNDIEKYIKEKLKEYIATSSVFTQRIQSDIGAQALFIEEIKRIKADKGEKGFPEAKGKIIKLAEVHYNMFLLDQSLKQLQGIIHEYGTLCKLFDVEVDVPEDAKAYYDTILSVNPHIFVVEQGQPVFVNNDLNTQLMDALRSKSNSEEALKLTYQTI